MLTVKLKLKLHKDQEIKLLEWLNILTGVYNWGIRQIKLNSENNLYLTAFDLNNLISGHSKKVGVSAQVLQSILLQSYNAWNRCFKKISKEPKLKGLRNKLNSIPFSQFDKYHQINGYSIHLPSLGETRFFKQEISDGKIKCGRIIKKSSGWYLVLVIDTEYKPKIPVIKTGSKVGIDTGFSTLATLSNGIKYENPRELRKSEERIAQAQRGYDKKLVAKLQEKQANRRKDRNHKISHDLVQRYDEIYMTNDNLQGQAKIFGKSVTEAGIAQLRNFTSYKSSSCDRKFALVDSHYTTMTCSCCGALSGPTGMDGLAVRYWVCSACGAHHDRDINSGMVVLNIGLGQSLVSSNKLFEEVNQKLYPFTEKRDLII